MAPGKEKLRPEQKNRVNLITVVTSAGRQLCLTSIFYQETLPIDGVLLIKYFDGLKSIINDSLKTNLKFFVHQVE